MSPRLLIVLSLASFSTACASHHGEYRFDQRHTTIETDPPGARVYQIAPVSDKFIDLGTTPIRDQPVMVLLGATNVDDPATRLPELYAQHGIVRVRIEKPGYVTYIGNLTTGEKETIPHKITLEPLPK
jgi:hypothetical protein